MIGVISAVHKIVPSEPKKISFKVLIQSPISETAPQPLEKSIPKPIPPAPTMKPVQPINPVKKTVIEQTKPIIASPQQIVPAAAAAVIMPSKIQETNPSIAAKASPSVPKQQENYEEENLGRIRSILMDRLIYPKNAVRLKQQGEATVTFTLETNREVSQITVTRSSGFELLDDAAKNLILSSASEFPKPSKTVRISVPIAYKLR
jgi:protein TonB